MKDVAISGFRARRMSEHVLGAKVCIGTLLGKRNVTQQKAYKFRIYPNKTQKVLLNKTFGCVRYVWNSWVEQFNSDNDDKFFKMTTDLRKQFLWMQEVSASALQQKYRDFLEFKKQFFNPKRKIKLGKPCFKSKYKRQSYRLTNQKFTVLQDCNKIRLEKIGRVKTVFDRNIPKNVKFLNVTISKDLVGDYYVSILVAENIEHSAKMGCAVGVDVGLKDFATLSTGEKFDASKFFRESQSELRSVQKHFCRKKKGSNRRRKAKIKVAKVHRKIDRQRAYFLHCVSSYLVNNFDVIAVEDLNIKGMVKNHCLAKSIQDASWSKFFSQLEYKTQWYGKELRRAARFEPTSKKCSVCGYYFKDLTLDIREWKCPDCNTVHDRDINAAKNILSVGVATGIQTWRECKTQETSVPCAVFCEASKVA